VLLLVRITGELDVAAAFDGRALTFALHVDGTFPITPSLGNFSVQADG
jgi:hypothetical protein